jgi:hypothetical protein
MDTVVVWRAVRHVVGTAVKQAASLMVGNDDHLRTLTDQGAVEEAFLDRLRQTENDPPCVAAAEPGASSAVSLMITSQQRMALQELGISDAVIRFLTPAEAHAQLGLIKSNV